MPRRITPDLTIDVLKKEAKRWLKALRAGDPEARARLERAVPAAPHAPTLRDIQFGLAREFGLPGWSDVKTQLATSAAPGGSNESAPAALGEGDLLKRDWGTKGWEPLSYLCFTRLPAIGSFTPFPALRRRRRCAMCSSRSRASSGSTVGRR